jgi:hypothetical protein
MKSEEVSPFVCRDLCVKNGTNQKNPNNVRINRKVHLTCLIHVADEEMKQIEACSTLQITMTIFHQLEDKSW